MPDMTQPQGGRIAKLDEDQRIAFGWAYISHDAAGNVITDRQGDFIDDPEVLAKAAYDYVIDFAQGDVLHNQVPVASIVESVVFTPEKVQKMGMLPNTMPCGWWIGMKVHDDSTWDRIKKGELPMFSVGGRGIREVVED